MAFYPDMVRSLLLQQPSRCKTVHVWELTSSFQVNMIVLGKNLGIPKPFGPRVNGRCALEAEMCSLMEGLGLSCTFIDDFSSYHKLLGEVHCGSNVRREPFAFKWWNLEM